MATATAKRSRALTAFVRTEGHCYYCGISLDFALRGNNKDDQWNIDHIIARAKGGTNAPENLVATCIPCNTLKGHLSVQEFRQKVQLMCEHYQAFIEQYSGFADIDVSKLTVL